MNKLLIALMSISLLLTACSPKSEESVTESADKATTSIDAEPATDTQAPEVPPLETDSPMQAELIALIQTLESIAVKGEEKQIIIDEKMQVAKTKADNDEISRMTIELLQEQQSALNELPLTEPQLINIRQKLVQSTELGIDANKDMMKAKEMTSQDEDAIVEKFDKGQTLSDEAKNELMALIEDLGLGVNS